MSSKEMSWAMDQQTGAPVHKLVLLVIADGYNDEDGVPVNAEWIARKAECDAVQVNASISEMATLGLLRRREDGRVMLLI